MADCQDDQNRKEINVTYNDKDGSLRVDPDYRTLSTTEDGMPAPSVTWRFHNIEGPLERGYRPSLRFDVPFMGPFKTACQTAEYVIGNGNIGGDEIQEYQYQAVLKPECNTLPTIISETAHLVNEVTGSGVDTGPFFEVQIQKKDERFKLDVQPNVIQRTAGQPVVWKVVGPAPDGIDAWFPKIMFYDLPEGAHPHFGPFTSWQTNGSLLVGSGSSGICGSFHYRF